MLKIKLFIAFEGSQQLTKKKGLITKPLLCDYPKKYDIWMKKYHNLQKRKRKLKLKDLL